MSGRLFVIVGPSGAGKDTLIAGAIAADPALHWAQRVITRPTSAGGEPFEGVSPAEFQRRLSAGDFVLHWQAHGLNYGVTVPALGLLQSGAKVVLNESRGALGAISAAFAGLRIIRISAPSAVLAERLAQRGRESSEAISARLARASYDLPAELSVIDVQNTGSIAQGIDALRHALSL